MARTVRVGISFVLLLGASACAATSPTPPPVLLGDVERASLGTVGVASFASAPNTSLPDPGFISGAAKAAGDWAAFFGSGNGGFASLGILFFPVAGLVGGVEAETTGLSGTDKREIAVMLRRALPEPESQNELREHVRTHAAADAKEMWLDLGTVGPRSQRTTPGYGLPSGKNVTTMLEVGLLEVTVTRAGDKDPDIGVRITAGARLLRVSDRRLLWSNDQFVNNIRARKLSEFEANDAALLKSNVVDTLDLLAREIVFAVLPEGRPNAACGCE
jgi:hypothetical protein